MDTVTIKVVKGVFFHGGRSYGKGCAAGDLIHGFPRKDAETHVRTGAAVIIEAKAPTMKPELPLGPTGQPSVTGRNKRGRRG